MWNMMGLVVLLCIAVQAAGFAANAAVSSRVLTRRRAFVAMAVPYMKPSDFNNNRNRQPPPPINQFIRADPIRLIAPKEDGEEGEEEMLGVYSLEDARAKADEMDLDLVMINENGDPPVCKIVDYGKFKYVAEKKKKENMKKQVQGGMKEVKMSYKIDTHDFDVRVKAAQRFIKSGDRVKVVVQFKGREMQHRDLGHQILMKFFEPINDVAVIESVPKMEGRAMSMLVGPKKTT
jgi:translation initiation factor IF-3